MWFGLCCYGYKKDLKLWIFDIRLFDWKDVNILEL